MPILFMHIRDGPKCKQSKNQKLYKYFKSKENEIFKTPFVPFWSLVHVCADAFKVLKVAADQH